MTLGIKSSFPTIHTSCHGSQRTIWCILSCFLFWIFHLSQCCFERLEDNFTRLQYSMAEGYVHIHSGLLYSNNRSRPFSVLNNHRAHFSVWESSVHCPGVGNETAWDDNWTWMGRAPLAWQLSPPAPSLAPLPPFFQASWCFLIGWDTRRHPLFAHPDRTAYGGQTERALRVWLRPWRRGGEAKRCQLSGVMLLSEASWTNITGAGGKQRWWRKAGEEHNKGDQKPKGTGMWLRGRLCRKDDRDLQHHPAPTYAPFCIYCIAIQYYIFFNFSS